MGTQDRRHREDKRGRRTGRTDAAGRRDDTSGRSNRESATSGADGDAAGGGIARTIAIACEAFRIGDHARFEQAIALLVEGPPVQGGDTIVDQRIATALRRAIRRTWYEGWQPADVVRALARRADRSTVDLVTDIIAADMAGYPADAVHPRWRDQVETLGATVWWADTAPHLGQWASKTSRGRADTLRTAAILLCCLEHLPALPLLCPPPGGDPTDRPRVSLLWAAPKGQPSPVLERVRALLTKAESTTFPEEAEALSAKAQQLMATHSIDRIAMAAERGGDHRPIGRRIGVDDPYSAARALLLGKVAEANRCRSVWTGELGFATVFGAEPDVDAVDILFTSLLSQATSALRIADRHRRGDAATRTRSFRQSFHVGYAMRISSRLAEVVATAQAMTAAAHGADLLPVLARHDEDVANALSAAFPGVAPRRVSVSNEAGWTSGMAAAEVASLTIHPEVDERSTP